jgi:hypothetical protein
MVRSAQNIHSGSPVSALRSDRGIMPVIKDQITALRRHNG